MTSGNKPCLIQRIDKGLRVVPKEAADRITLILTREDHFNQGRKFV